MDVKPEPKEKTISETIADQHKVLGETLSKIDAQIEELKKNRAKVNAMLKALNK